MEPIPLEHGNEKRLSCMLTEAFWADPLYRIIAPDLARRIKRIRREDYQR